MESGVLVFDDLLETVLGNQVDTRISVSQNQTPTLLVFDSERRIVPDLTDSTDFVIFDSPIPEIVAVEPPQEFLLIDDPQSLEVQTDTGTEILVIQAAGLRGKEGPQGPPGLGVLLLENGASVPLDTPIGTIIYEKQVP